MTPETIRIVHHLRQEFYSLFAMAMQLPVNIASSNAYASNLPIASWMDDRKQLNYVYLYAYTAPDDLIPDRPFILRIAINKRADIVAVSRQKKGCRGLNRSWNFEVTLLPEEVLDFLPWVVNLVEFHDAGTGFQLFPGSPYPLESDHSDGSLLNNPWTQKANCRRAAHHSLTASLS
jgi:hypothetical protein